MNTYGLSDASSVSDMARKILGNGVEIGIGFLLLHVLYDIAIHGYVLATFRRPDLPDLTDSGVTSVPIRYGIQRPAFALFFWLMIAVGTAASSYVRHRMMYPRLRAIWLAALAMLLFYVLLEFVANLIWLLAPPETALISAESFDLMMHAFHTAVALLQLLSILQLAQLWKPWYICLYESGQAMVLNHHLVNPPSHDQQQQQQRLVIQP